MSVIGNIGKFLLSGLLGVAIGGGGKKADPAAQAQANPLPAANRDDARTQAQRDDELRRRKGAAADLITGSSGAEASSASLGKLVVGS